MTKKQLSENVQALLGSKKRFELFTTEEAQWLTDNVFRFHPEWDWYLTRHPKSIYKDIAKHGTYCFYIEFENGEKSSISYIKCIKNKK